MKCVRASLCLLAVALVACSRPPPVDDAAGTAQPPAAAVAAASPATPTPQPAPIATQGSGLTGTVSGLSAQVSDLKGLISALGGEVRDQQIHVALPADTLFAFDRADIAPAATANLDKLLALLKQTTGPIKLLGYTDDKGDEAYNLSLSQRRADAVAVWLGARGIASERLLPEGRGEADPVAPNSKADGSDDPDARQRNRRVEVIVPLPQ